MGGSKYHYLKGNYVLMEKIMLLDLKETFHSKHYLLHNEKRLAHLARLGLPIEPNMPVLEVGTGIGDHTSFFLDRGCVVTSTKGRPECCRPTRSWLVIKLGDLFEYVCLPITQPDHPEFPNNWFEAPNLLSRAVFVASRTPLDNPLLVGDLPMMQQPFRGYNEIDNQ